ncbi:MAG TPA: APC family permease [Candidatus Limnocylindrales bacterium]|nr:APC family permease [Candidatus Limnocylindrales bacterium]
MHTPAAVRRRVKFHGASLGPLLCWSIVFADIGTSIYYVPGILSASGYNKRAAIFVLMTLFVFILLALKYAEVTWRNPEGGGVVTISSRALHPLAGLVGGLFIIVDYYLTAAISAFSGVAYFAVVIPVVGIGNAVPGTLVALAFLATLNIYGIRESATVSFVAASVAAASQLIVVVVIAVHLGLGGVFHSFSAVTQGPPPFTPLTILTGFGAAFLAFSGLESVAQIAPAMRSPRRVTAYRTMALVILTMTITSPLLTLWQTTLVPDPNSPNHVNQLLSLLAGQFSGQALAALVAVAGSILLIFASNTAIIGGYHVFLALTRMGFLPRVVEKRNTWRRTPHIAILAAMGPPVILVYVAGQSPVAAVFLGDLYAFGLLGSFILTNVSLDVVRWRELKVDGALRRRLWFGIGVLTTALTVIGWSVNLVAKPYATAFGGGLTLIGLAVGLWTYNRGRRRRPTVFPVPYRPDLAAESIALQFQRNPADVLVILPRDQNTADAVIDEGMFAADGKRIVFLYRGQSPPGPAELWEVSDPYLKDYVAQDAFTRAEMRSRGRIQHRRYVYVPGSLPRDAIGRVWAEVRPHETVVVQGEQDVLPPLAVDRVRHRVHAGVPVLHLVSSHIRPTDVAAAG